MDFSLIFFPTSLWVATLLIFSASQRAEIAAIIVLVILELLRELRAWVRWRRVKALEKELAFGKHLLEKQHNRERIAPDQPKNTK